MAVCCGYDAKEIETIEVSSRSFFIANYEARIELFSSNERYYKL
jgi:hypothetical protein